MAIVRNVTLPCPACNCTDSPLSITGNLTGILTFALVVWASIVYCYRSFRDFEQEMHEMQHRVQVAFKNTARIRRSFIEKQRMSPLRFSQTGGDDARAQSRKGAQATYPYVMDEAWSRAEREMVKAAKFVNKRLLEPNTVVGVLRSRTAYVVEREKAAETVEKLERAIENVKGIVADAPGQYVSFLFLATCPPRHVESRECARVCEC